MTGRLFLVDLPYACFGIVVHHGKVTLAPPIAAWMVGKDGRTVDSWIRRKGGTIKECT